MKTSLIAFILGLFFLSNSVPIYATENYFACSQIDRVILILDHQNSLTDVNVRMKPSGKLFTLRFTGQNYESRAADMATHIKNCPLGINFIFPGTGAPGTTQGGIASKVNITVLAR